MQLGSLGGIRRKAEKLEVEFSESKSRSLAALGMTIFMGWGKWRVIRGLTLRGGSGEMWSTEKRKDNAEAQS
jgi:hypothetical protein